MKLYHATYVAYLEGILEHGLVPGQRKNWENCEDGFVYLATDPDVAVSFCETAEDVPDDIFASGICCFEVDSGVLDGGRLVADPNILEDEDIPSGCYAYGGVIPYGALTLVYQERDDEVIMMRLDDQIQEALEVQGNSGHNSFEKKVDFDR